MTFRAPHFTRPVAAVLISAALVSQGLGNNPNLFTNPVPFKQTEWPNPNNGLSRQAALGSQQLGSPQPLVFPNSMPFSQKDWPNPNNGVSRQPALGTAGSWSSYIGLFPVVVAAPFRQLDWPNPNNGLSRQAAIVAQISVRFNLNLYTNPKPFAQLDWPNPFQVIPPRVAHFAQPLGSLTWTIPAAIFTGRSFGTIIG